MKIANELFSWFKHESICPDVRAFNATILVHSTPNSIIGKGDCVWRSQMCYLADLSTRPYVLMLERWMLLLLYIQRSTVLLVRNVVHENHKWNFLVDVSTSRYVLMLERWVLPFSYIQRATVKMVRDIVHKDQNWVFSSWIKHAFICPDARVLNATIFVHSTPNSTIGKKYYVWRLQVSWLVDLSTSPYVFMLERWLLPFSYIRRPRLLLVRKIVHENFKWVI